MNINKELDELFSLLDENDDIKKIDELKKKITNKEIELIHNYRNNPNIENKTKLYNNAIIKEYLESETKVNYLIMQINSRFKRRKSCESNKW